jgi:hypothetical protein
MMSDTKRHFFQTFIAPKYISIYVDLKLLMVFFNCYEYFTNLLSVINYTNHLISGIKGDSFIDNEILFNKLAFR